VRLDSVCEFDFHQYLNLVCFWIFKKLNPDHIHLSYPGHLLKLLLDLLATCGNNGCKAFT